MTTELMLSRASHPASSAPPIFPQPTRMMGAARPVMAGDCWSGLAGRIEAGAGHGLGGILAAPSDGLEGRIEAFAFVQRHIDEVFELLHCSATCAAQGNGMAERGLIVFRRQ